jgi:hypothetical protein
MRLGEPVCQIGGVRAGRTVLFPIVKSFCKEIEQFVHGLKVAWLQAADIQNHLQFPKNASKKQKRRPEGRRSFR